MGIFGMNPWTRESVGEFLGGVPRGLLNAAQGTAEMAQMTSNPYLDALGQFGELSTNKVRRHWYGDDEEYTPPERFTAPWFGEVAGEFAPDVLEGGLGLLGGVGRAAARNLGKLGINSAKRKARKIYRNVDDLPEDVRKLALTEPKTVFHGTSNDFPSSTPTTSGKARGLRRTTVGSTPAIAQELPPATPRTWSKETEGGRTIRVRPSRESRLSLWGP